MSNKFQELYSKEFEDKKTELQPKVVEIYEAAAVEIKVFIYILYLNIKKEKYIVIIYALLLYIIANKHRTYCSYLFMMEKKRLWWKNQRFQDWRNTQLKSRNYLMSLSRLVGLHFFYFVFSYDTVVFAVYVSNYIYFYFILRNTIILLFGVNEFLNYLIMIFLIFLNLFLNY